MAKFKTTRPIRLKGKRVEAGETVDLTADQAKDLTDGANKAVEPAGSKPGNGGQGGQGDQGDKDQGKDGKDTGGKDADA